MTDYQDRRVLAVGAHPDDVEFICSGTLFLLQELGCPIHIATMTAGDGGSMTQPAQEISRRRLQEAEAAAEQLGAQYHYLGVSDFCIFNDDPTNRRVTALLREVDPWLVFTHPPVDYLSDHEITSRLVRNACFYAAVANYQTLQYTQAERASKVPFLFYAQPLEGIDLYGSPVMPHFYVDVSDREEKKAEMLACHESQREWLHAHHGIDDYLDSMREWDARQGARASQIAGRTIRWAEGFRQHRGHSYPAENILGKVLRERIIEVA